MKKIILSAATILLISLSASAQEPTKCSNGKKCDPKECTTNGKCDPSKCNETCKEDKKCKKSKKCKSQYGSEALKPE